MTPVYGVESGSSRGSRRWSHHNRARGIRYALQAFYVFILGDVEPHGRIFLVKVYAAKSAHYSKVVSHRISSLNEPTHAIEAIAPAGLARAV